MLTMYTHQRYTHPFTHTRAWILTGMLNFPHTRTALNVPRGFCGTARPLPTCRSTWFARQPRNLHQGTCASSVHELAKPVHRTHITKHAGMHTPPRRVLLQIPNLPICTKSMCAVYVPLCACRNCRLQLLIGFWVTTFHGFGIMEGPN